MRLLRRGRRATAVVLMVAGLAACTSDDDSDADDPATTSTAPDITLTRPNAPLDVTIEQIGGSIPKSRRGAITEAISKPVATWIDGAYLDPSYPTSDFRDGFASWTPTAAKLGEHDQDTTTNQTIGRTAVAVVA